MSGGVSVSGGEEVLCLPGDKTHIIITGDILRYLVPHYLLPERDERDEREGGEGER